MGRRAPYHEAWQAERATMSSPPTCGGEVFSLFWARQPRMLEMARSSGSRPGT